MDKYVRTIQDEMHSADVLQPVTPFFVRDVIIGDKVTFPMDGQSLCLNDKPLKYKVLHGILHVYFQLCKTFVLDYRFKWNKQ